MSRKRRDKEYLSDAVEAVQRIVAYTGELTYEEFLADRKTQDAVPRNLQVMGEAVKRLSAEAKQARPHFLLEANGWDAGQGGARLFRHQL